MNSSSEERLSTAGETRREAMLAELVQVVEKTHRHRQMRRRMRYGLVAAASGAALIGIVIHLQPTLQGNAEPSHRIAQTTKPLPDSTPVIAPTPAFVTKRVQTDPSIVDRYRATPAHLIEQIDDQTLLEILASINRPAGLIRYGDRVALTRPVDDESLGLVR